MARPVGQPQPGPGAARQPPISFKTVPGRNRTQKWNQAKTYNYDGDDWGGFDPYDEYGGSDVSTSSGPYPQPQPGMQRQQSFEAGTERRQFSAPVHQFGEDRSRSPAKSTGSGGQSDREQGRRREYSNPAQVPPPLNTRSSPQPTDNRLRNDSIGSDAAPLDATSPASAKSEKPLPFIRPSDIYKRMAEEREKERQSLDSSRPSMESLQREGTPSSAQRPLSTVQERPGSGDISTLIQPEADLHPGYGVGTAPTMSPSMDRPVLPPVGAISDFGADVLRAADTSETVVPHSIAQQTVTPISSAPQTTPQQAHTGLQDIVQTAFDRQDSTSSHAASDFSRSNTNSTSAISPIMSRVPSTAISAQRQHDRDTTVPPIAEEPSAGHSRNASGETLVPQNSIQAVTTSTGHDTLAENPYRRSLHAVTPPTVESPARTPALETVEPRRLSGPLTAEIASEHAGTSTGRPRAGTDYSLREADLARTASTAQHPDQTVGLAQAESALQNQFIDEHSQEAATPIEPAMKPASQGRETSSLRPAQPAQPSRLNSFQPHMPGEWISPAPTPAVETPQTIRQNQPSAPSRLAQSRTVDEEQPDFSPNTSRNTQRDDSIGGALTAVKDAGSALGVALLSTAGLGHQTRDFASSDSKQAPKQPEQSRMQIGNITSRYPLARLASDAPTDAASVASDAPPTPPAKDSSYAASKSNAPASYFPPTAPSQPQQTSTREFESDRLSKDIVQSLNQYGTTTTEQRQSNSDASRPSELPSTLSMSGPNTTARPAFIDQRFSWESRHDDASSLPAITPIPAPAPAPIAVVGELPGDKDRQSYERPPDGQGLHVVNAPEEELVSPISKAESPIAHLAPPVSEPTRSLDVPAGENIHRSELSPSPVSMDESTHIPSYYAGVTDANFENVATPELGGPESEEALAEERENSAAPSPQPALQAQRQSGRIPPFREILAMKEAPERIKTYSETRQNFAEMNTGLNGWMQGLLERHPEHSGLVNASGGFNTDSVQIDPGSIGRGHRHNPSLLKIKQFTSTLAPGDNAPDTPPKDYDSGRQQMEKMQAKGKEMMKSASAFGGKAQAGAMGLFAKGRNKLRGDKVHPAHPPPPPIPESQAAPARPSQSRRSSRRASRTLSSEILAAELAREFTEQRHPEEAIELDDEADTKRPTDIQPAETRDSTTTDKSGPSKPSLFERLRRRSQSLTRSISRPTSTLLTNDKAEPMESDSRSRSRPRSLGLLGGRSDDSKRQVKATSTYDAVPALPEFSRDVVTPPNKTRTEAWEHADALPRLSEGNEDGTGRLGLLPSPSTFVFSEHEVSPARRRKDSLAARLAERGDLFGEPGQDDIARVEEPSATNPLVNEVAKSTTELQASAPIEPIQAPEPENQSADLPLDPAPIDTPKEQLADSPPRPGPIVEPTQVVEDASKGKHQRRLSDLSTLPSQLKLLEATPAPYWERSAKGDVEADRYSASYKSYEGGPVVSEHEEVNEKTMLVSKGDTVDNRAQDVPDFQSTPRQDEITTNAQAYHEPIEHKQESDTIAGAEMENQASLLTSEADRSSTLLPHNIAKADPGSSNDIPINHTEVLQPTDDNLGQQASDAVALAPFSAPAQSHEPAGPVTDAEFDRRSIVSAQDGGDKRSVRSVRSAVSSIHKADGLGSVTIIKPQKELPQQPYPTAEQRQTIRPVLSSPSDSYSTLFRPLDEIELSPILQMTQPGHRQPALSRDLAPGEHSMSSAPMGFANRPYNTVPADRRPMSYSPLPRDDSGRPIQETINDAQTQAPADRQRRRSSAIMLSNVLQNAVAGPSHVHPLFRDRSREAVPVLNGVEPRERRSSKPRLSVAAFPSSSQIDDQYGLEDAPEASVDDPIINYDMARPAKRKSGLWQALRRVSSPGQAQPSRSVGEEIPPVVPVKSQRRSLDILGRASEGDTRPKTLRKPERAVSAAMDSEIKKRRFSGLGSLFSKQAAQAQSGPSKKLMKKTRPPAEPVMEIEHPAQGYYRQPPVPTNYQSNEATRRRSSGPANYQDYEAARREANRLAHQPRTMPESSATTYEYYGSPNGARAQVENNAKSPSHALQDEWYWHDQIQNVPEAFRPVEASYGRAKSIGPPAPQVRPVEPPVYSDMTPRPNWPLRGDSLRYVDSGVQENSSSDKVLSQDIRNARQPAMQTRSQPSSYEYADPASQIMMPAYSSFEAQQFSQSNDTARSPAREYADQQTPYIITLPEPEQSQAVPAHARTVDSYSALPTIDPRQQYDVRQPLQVRRPSYPVYESQMRGTSYPGQEWMPSVHGYT